MSNIREAEGESPIKFSSSQSAFFCMDNIGKFLKAAESYGVKRNDLFQVSKANCMQQGRACCHFPRTLSRGACQVRCRTKRYTCTEFLLCASIINIIEDIMYLMQHQTLNSFILQCSVSRHRICMKESRDLSSMFSLVCMLLAWSASPSTISQSTADAGRWRRRIDEDSPKRRSGRNLLQWFLRSPLRLMVWHRSPVCAHQALPATLLIRSDFDNCTRQFTLQ